MKYRKKWQLYTLGKDGMMAERRVLESNFTFTFYFIFLVTFVFYWKGKYLPKI